MNRAEGNRHRLASGLLASLGRRVVVPWPVYAEVDLLLRSRNHPEPALAFGVALNEGVHQLLAPSADELRMALSLGERYLDTGVDLPDLMVMAMATSRDCPILTWDFRHFRTVVLRQRHYWDLLVGEADLPTS